MTSLQYGFLESHHNSCFPVSTGLSCEAKAMQTLFSLETIWGSGVGYACPLFSQIVFQNFYHRWTQRHTPRPTQSHAPKPTLAQKPHTKTKSIRKQDLPSSFQQQTSLLPGTHEAAGMPMCSRAPPVGCRFCDYPHFCKSGGFGWPCRGMLSSAVKRPFVVELRGCAQEAEVSLCRARL